MNNFKKLTVKENTIAFYNAYSITDYRMIIGFKTNEQTTNFKTFNLILKTINYVDDKFNAKTDDTRTVRNLIKQGLYTIYDIKQLEHESDLRMTYDLYQVYDITTEKEIFTFSILEL